MIAVGRRPIAASKPLPPFGKRVAECVRQGVPTNTFIMAGPDAWNRHRIRVDRVVLPPDAAPDDYDWTVFRGQEPTIIADDAPPERIERLIWLLLRAGVKVVGVIFHEDGATMMRHFRV